MTAKDPLDELTHFSCIQCVFRRLMAFLGAPDEGEDYWGLSEVIVVKFSSLQTDPEVFLKAINDAEDDEPEEDWLISRELGLAILSDLRSRRSFRVEDAVSAGARELVAQVQRSENNTHQAKPSLQSERGPRLTPEDRYSMMLIAQQSSGVVDAISMMSAADDFVEEAVEVEIEERVPTFLVGKLQKKAINYRMPRAPVRPTGVFRGKGMTKPDDDDDQRTAMEKIADKQEEVSKQRKAALRLIKAASGEEPSGLEATKPVALSLELGEAPEERGIRSVKDLGTKVPPWMKAGSGGTVSFGPKSNQSLQAVRQSLPIFQHKQRILDCVAANRVTVLVGEPGSGKTTQLTQYLVDGGYHKKGMIGCTQPRRVAATSVAKRVAEEFGCQLGEEVGYSVRFEDKTSRLTIIRYMTDGMLMREALLDEVFSRYSIVVLDEAHERSVNTDVLFGLMIRALAKRPDLKLIVTSATLEIDRFCAYFDSKEPVKIPGNTFPVQLHYEDPSDDYVEAAVEQVMRIHLEKPGGDILVFLTGEAEIENAAQRLYNWTQKLEDIPELIILPIYSALPNEVQSRVFEKTPPLSRKVVLATNIAETSITIPDLFYVIDPGFCKMKRYNPVTGVEQLKVVPISQSQARQRMGRAGRTGPGMCYRLYTEDHFNQLKPATEPEIQRCNLANVVLTLKAVGVRDVFEFEFMDKPNHDALVSAMEKLFYLEALDDSGTLTNFGWRMSSLPVEPTLARTLLTAVDMGCLPAVVTAVAMLMAPHVFHRPREKQEEADRKHAAFRHHDGDQLTLVAVYDAWVAAGETEEWARSHFVNFRALREARESRAQLETLLKQDRSKGSAGASDTISVRKALTAGYFFQAAKRMNDGRYLTMTDRREVAIHPSSALFHIKPKYVVFHELVKTTREFMREVMTISPSWLVELAPAFYSKPKDGRLTKEQMAERIDPTLRRWEQGNDWRISKLRRRGR